MSEPSVAIDGPHVAAASMDGVGMLQGTEYVYANDELADIHGYEDPQELIGQRWGELYSPEERSLEAQDVLSRSRDDGEWRGRVIGEKRDGSSVPLEVSLMEAVEGTVCVIRDITERIERSKELERYETILDTVDDGVYVLNEELRVEMANERFFGMLETFGFSREEVREMHAHDLVVKDDERTALERTIEQAIEEEPHTGSFEMSAETPDGDSIVCESRFRLYPEPDGEHRGCIGILRDITDRKDRERQLQRQRDELDTLNRINEVLLEIARGVFESPRQGEIEQRVCETLAESDLYQFAWIGKPELGGNRLVPDASAGVDDTYLDSITITTDKGETGQGPGGRAFRSGTIQVSQDIETDPTFEPWREATLTRDVRSAAAVPLNYDGTTYGILAVYAPRPLAFSQREQRGFETLGEAIGYAINATRTRQLLHAQRIVELDLRLTAPNELVIDATERLDCHLSLEGYVSAGDDSWLMYFTVSQATPDRFIEVADGQTPVDLIRRGSDDGTPQVVALTIQSRLLDSIAALGGKVASGSLEDGSGTFVVRIPQSTDVREFIEQVRSTYPGTELLAKREVERPAEQSAWPTTERPVDLTERQRQALEAAYHAGYFEWPRENTAEEVADLLNISRPTLQAHLRKAERELLERFLDGSESGLLAADGR